MQKVYFKAKRHTITGMSRVTMDDIGKWECTDSAVLGKIKALHLHRFEEKGQKNQMEFFSVLKVIEVIHRKMPEVEIESLGDPDFVVEYVKNQRENLWINRFKLWLLCVLIFFGSAFTIMAFNNDVDIMGVFRRFYEQVMGVEKPAASELEIAYSLGVAVGILVFFNHFGKRKFASDPTPIQVEVTKFRKDMDETLLENAEREEHEQDVF